MVFIKFIITSLMVISILSQPLQACTTFCLDHGGKPVFGRNYDWMVGHCLVMINKRGVSKISFLVALQQTRKALTWTSKYGSATFNQAGREFPLGGMNEAGLVIEIMMLDDTYYGKADGRLAIFSIQWIQYQLDNFSTVEEVIESDARIRLRALGWPGVHFLVCDKNGNAATIEYINGKMVYHTGTRLPVKALTNSKYADSVRFWKEGRLPQIDHYQSIERFVRTANLVNTYDPESSQDPIAFAFNILKNVEHASVTQLSVVYDINLRRIYFHTRFNRKVRFFNLRDFDLSCASPVKVVDANADFSGDISDRFEDYSDKVNRDLISKAFKDIEPYKPPPLTVTDMLSRYPESTSCEE